MTETIEQFIVKFDVNKAILTKLADEARAIDTKDIEQVETAIKNLVKVRGQIERQGKGFRDESNAYNKRVLADEKDYIKMIEPIEIEYKALVEQEKQKRILEARKELLPMKLQQLEMLEHRHEVLSDTILEMSDETWVAYYQTEMQYNNEKKATIALQAQQKVEQEQREFQIRKDMELKAEQDEIKKAKELADKEFAEKNKLDADKKYQDFLSSNNYTETTDILQNNGGEVSVYRLVATYKK